MTKVIPFAFLSFMLLAGCSKQEASLNKPVDAATAASAPASEVIDLTKLKPMPGAEPIKDNPLKAPPPESLQVISNGASAPSKE